jgi:hypothetical protein
VIGTSLNQYQITGALGAGGMGEVFRSRGQTAQSRLGRSKRRFHAHKQANQMNSPTLHRLVLATINILMLSMVGCATAPKSTIAPADPADVRTVADLVRASYEVINGPAGVPRQWDRDRTFYMPGATYVSVWEEDGKVKTKIMTPEDYRRDFTIGAGVFETEVGRRIERYGHVAQVRSVAVVRSTPDRPVRARYINYFHLYWDGSRWWIAGMVWEKESPSAPIPEAWIGKFEEVIR